MEIEKTVARAVSGREAVLFWSGGFESTFLLNYITAKKMYESCRIKVITVAFPQEIYVAEKLNGITGRLKDLGMEAVVLTPEVVMSHGINYSSACPECKKIRRDIILRYLDDCRQSERPTVYVTGHNLDDLASYTLELISKKFQGGDVNGERLLECANKFTEIFDYGENITLLRPLARYSMAELQRINGGINDYGYDLAVHKKCYWINQRKRLLQRYFESAGLKLDYDSVKKVFLQNFEMPTDGQFRSIPFDTYLM